MQGRMQTSDQGYHANDENTMIDDEEEEEMIEEDICDNEQSPPTHNKHQTGKKTKALFHG